MAVGLILGVGILLLIALGLLFIYLDRREQRKQKLREKQEETKQEEARATERLVDHAEQERFDE